MYTYEENGKTGEKVDAIPCYICKKMIINAGLSRFIGNAKDGAVRVFHIEDWVAEWKQGDILDDKHQYGKDQNEKEGLAKEKEKPADAGSAGFMSIKEVLMQEGKREDINKNGFV
jgi:hypothetical protein